MNNLERHFLTKSHEFESLKEDLEEYSPHLMGQNFFNNLVICGYHFENLKNVQKHSFIEEFPEYSLENDELTKYYTQLYNLEH